MASLNSPGQTEAQLLAGLQIPQDMNQPLPNINVSTQNQNQMYFVPMPVNQFATQQLSSPFDTTFGSTGFNYMVADIYLYVVLII